MDLLRIQDALKNASDQQLVQMMQAPDSSAPSYLVLSELRRRKDMRDKAIPQEGPSGTVADELTQQATPVEPMGIHSLRTPVEEEPAEPQAYRSGGIVRMAEGGDVELPLPPPQMPSPPRGLARASAGIESLANPESIPSFADIYARNEGLIPDTTGELRERLQQDRVDPAARRNEALNMALIDAGLRIAASRNPSLLGAIGEGAAPAVQGYTQQLGQVRQEQRQARQDELELAKQDANRRFAIGQLTANEYRGIMQDIQAERRARQQLVAAAASAGRAEAAAAARHSGMMALEERRITAQEDADKRRLERETARLEQESQSRLLMSAAQEAARVLRDPTQATMLRAQIMRERQQLNPRGPAPTVTDSDLENYLIDRTLRTYSTVQGRFGQGQRPQGGSGSQLPMAQTEDLQDPLGIRR